MIEMNAIRPAFEKLRIKISPSFLKHLIRATEAFNRREASPPHQQLSAFAIRCCIQEVLFHLFET
jgi:hypothetical protein